MRKKGRRPTKKLCLKGFSPESDDPIGQNISIYATIEIAIMP